MDFGQFMFFFEELRDFEICYLLQVGRTPFIACSYHISLNLNVNFTMLHQLHWMRLLENKAMKD